MGFKIKKNYVIKSHGYSIMFISIYFLKDAKCKLREAH